ncbi:hypothetical protein EYB53_011255 [Candidatus Chloroploca sp. M-50]|uniref:ABC transporter permease n=1 Tax=Candidatus Chloroploca mongolica TaxID=2528176 RepID=A0ABS4DA08_9CHLR|nr:hypothetical protein [Candidatus Chloroploca mongolica]MBP1466283.1 hypothetical protein [Candidatus Chloroploca mongolica]
MRIAGWGEDQGLEELTRNLAFTLVLFWLGLGAWAGVGALRLGLARDEQQLLLTLPLRPADRWHALLVRVVREWVGLVPLALTLTALGGGLTALGTPSLLWLLAAGVGVALALVAGPLIAVGGAALLLRLPLPSGSDGWLAGLGGRCLEALTLRQSSRDRAPTAHILPGIALLSAVVARRRTPVAAILWRSLISQSRNWTFRLRVLMTPVLCAGGLWLSGQVTLPGLGDGQRLAAFAVVLALLTIADGAASPVGGEGERLAVLLTAPVSAGALLRGKLLAMLLAVGVQALFVTATLGVLLQLGAGAVLLVLAQVLVALLGLVALFVGGSVWDSDLSRQVEGAMQALLVEEVPVTPMRLILIGLGSLLVTAQIWLIVALDGALALAALAALTAVVVAGSSVGGRLALPQIVR